MSIIESVREKAASKKKKIVLPRSSDERVVKAARFLQDEGLADVILLSNKGSKIESQDIKVLDPETDEKLEEFAEAFYQKRKHKGITEEQALDIVKDPLFFGASLVSVGYADGCVAGSVSTTGDVLKAAIQTIGLKKGSNVVSSIFLMSFPDGRVFSYGDCAVVPYPTSDQLATIAFDSAVSHKLITGEEPKVAMLSFSTKGSAQHERVELVQQAFEKLKEYNIDFAVDGELQFDAAFVESVGKRKAPNSEVAGHANVYIFPNLDAGNIAYKITERLAGATATGPIIQGLAKPMMDLSRGCEWDDIVNTACVCSLMS
ncbi:MAG: phosphate acetyltransferase [Balneola sp.]|nr:phosphate acetyltransferase [Balneola sp.]MBO6650191.1 phosphate acetyltransferase [Balneola sp.]MBO6710555.1 phosphate acetyltransferase [Balneola sp.]MBO6799240.1 phosphate acetyltransferase [Balneola sp.]MBO6871079.1 phosphate acetyltransferase [Balneola sp.]